MGENQIAPHLVLNDLFRPLWEDLDSDYFILTGGRGSAKSYDVAAFLEILTFEKGHVILFTRYTMTSAHLSIIPEFVEKVELLEHEQNFKINKTDIRNLNGSKILFRGIMTSNGNQTARLKSITGLTTFVLDEAEELTDERTFDIIDDSIREKAAKNRAIIIMNPATKEHWVYKRFFEATGVPYDFNGVKGNVRYIHTTYLDNIENLSRKFIDRAAAVKEQDEEKHDHVYMGKWADRAEGVIFTNWKSQTFDDSLPSGYGLDFGFTHPDALVKVAIDEKRKRIYLKQMLHENGLSTSDLTEKLGKRILGREVIYADSAEPRLISELSKKFNIRAVHKYAGSVRDGIKIMQSYLICVDPNSLDLMKELNYYRWKEKGEIPVDEWNHLLDGGRYYVMSQLSGGRARTKAY